MDPAQRSRGARRQGPPDTCPASPGPVCTLLRAVVLMAGSWASQAGSAVRAATEEGSVASAEPEEGRLKAWGQRWGGGLPEAERMLQALTAAGLSSVSGNTRGCGPRPLGLTRTWGEAVRPRCLPQVPRLLSAPSAEALPFLPTPQPGPLGSPTRPLDVRTVGPTWCPPGPSTLALPASTGTYAPLRETLCWL